MDRTIDIHSHLFTHDCAAACSRVDADWQFSIQTNERGLHYIHIRDQMFGPVRPGMFDLAARRDDMERSRIERHVLSVMPFAFLYHAPVSCAVAFSRLQNEMLAAAVQRYPRQFVGLATVPLQDADAAVKELHYAVTQLGLRGVEIGTNVQGAYLDDPRFFPFYEAIQDLQAPVLIHPQDVAGGEALNPYFLRNLIGNPLDTAIAMARLILGGVLERFPRLRLCFVHGGGFLPYQIGRLDFAYRSRPELLGTLPKPPSEYFGTLYFDNLLFYEPAIEYLINQVGAEHVLLGTDYPFRLSDPNPVATLNRCARLDVDERRAVLGLSARQFLNLPDEEA